MPFFYTVSFFNINDYQNKKASFRHESSYRKSRKFSSIPIRPEQKAQYVDRIPLT